MINFGLPYQGSKSKIAADLIKVIPGGGRFVDVFAGGCAMTHAAMLAGRWKGFLANDITNVPLCFKQAIEGKFRDEKRWISREQFFELKDTDMYVRTCFSFGNNGVDYIYNVDIEPYKKACHYAILFDDWKLFQALCPEVTMVARKALAGKSDRVQRRLALGPMVLAELKRIAGPELIKRNPLYASVYKNRIVGDSFNPMNPESLERLERLQSLESLERLQSLQSLESHAFFEVQKGDYRDIEVNPGDVLYCDPPYKGTGGYNNTDFDHEAFYDWVEAQTVPVYISEYSMPQDRFLCVWRKKTQSRLSQKGTDGDVEEKLFVKRPKRK